MHVAHFQHAPAVEPGQHGLGVRAAHAQVRVQRCDAVHRTALAQSFQQAAHIDARCRSLESVCLARQISNGRPLDAAAAAQGAAQGGDGVAVFFTLENKGDVRDAQFALAHSGQSRAQIHAGPVLHGLGGLRGTPGRRSALGLAFSRFAGRRGGCAVLGQGQVLVQIDHTGLDAAGYGQGCAQGQAQVPAHRNVVQLHDDLAQMQGVVRVFQNAFEAQHVVVRGLERLPGQGGQLARRTFQAHGALEGLGRQGGLAAEGQAGLGRAQPGRGQAQALGLEIERPFADQLRGPGLLGQQAAQGREGQGNLAEGQMRRVIAQLGVQSQIAGQDGLLVLFEIKGKIALHAGFFAAAQIFHGKIEVLDLQMNAPGVHIAHFALAHHEAHQFHGQLIGRRDGSGLGAGNGGSGGSGRRRILSRPCPRALPARDCPGAPRAPPGCRRAAGPVPAPPCRF